ncbi:MAG TPA: MFS transporter [Steroidobacteraceae bacterium]|nr:MFS transporter [Steroidobacteraceae bacterium]
MYGGRRAAQWSWGLTAWANHAFVTTVAVGLFPIFFDRYWAAALPGTASTFYLGLTNSTASFAVMLLAPTLGALADRRGRKRAWFGVFTALGVAATVLLALAGRNRWQFALLVYGLGSLGFWMGYSFQDALITQVAEPHETNRVSAFGFALGYLGGGLLFLINVLLVLFPARFGLSGATAAMRVAFLDVAGWWLLFSLPLFRYVPEAPPVPGRAGWRELLATLRAVLGDRPVLRFLLAYWLYIDGINTLQFMAVDFGTKLGFPARSLILALLLTQFIAFPCALAFGRLGDRIGARRAIYLGLAVFVGVTIFGAFMRNATQFYALAAVVGTVQGGVQALSRSYFTRLIPRERSGEYFGFYNMLGKFAAVLGPVAMGIVAVATGSQRASPLVLIVFFVAGGWLLTRVREDTPRAHAARSSGDSVMRAGR